MARDSAFMRRALALARLGWGQTAPNPMVGAVVVRDGAVVGEGHHARYGAAHAEVEALQRAGEAARGAALYVTLEPCTHHGKTPPCVDAIIAAGIARVVAAVPDPTRPAGGGAEQLRAAGIEVQFGDGAAAASELNAPFLHASRGRPWVTLKLACSLDGAIADAGGRSRWITGERARREAHRMRSNSDAIMVGATTAAKDDPALTVRGSHHPRVPAARVIVDPSARLPLESQLVRTARRDAPVIVLATEAAPADRVEALAAAGVEVVRGGHLTDWLGALHTRGVRSVLVEGGARLAGALLAERLVDRLAIFHAPIILGAGALNAFAYAPAVSVEDVDRWRLIERKSLGDDVLTIVAPEGAP